MQLSRRQFVSWIGLSTVMGGANLVHGAGSPAEALSTILRDSKSKGEKEIGAHGTAEIKPKVLSSPDEIWADLLEGNRRFMAGKP